MLQELAVQVRTDLMAQVIQPWRFTSPEAKLTVHIRDRAPDGELLGLHDARCARSQAGRHLSGGARPDHQAGRDGLSAHGQGPHRAPPGERAGAADHRLRALRRGPNQLEQRTDQASSCARASATRPSCCARPNDPVYKASPGSFTSELHERLASPLYAFAFVLMVLAFMGQAQTTRTNRMQAVIAAFAVAVGLPHRRHRAPPMPRPCALAVPVAVCRAACAAAAVAAMIDPMAPLPAPAAPGRARR